MNKRVEKFFYILVLCCFVISCNTRNTMTLATDVDAEISAVIDITDLYSDSTRKFVDNYIERMEVICLETNDSSIVYGVDEVVASQTHIYIRDFYKGGVAIFDRDGRFVKRLPNGNAPFEIGRAGSFFLTIQQASFMSMIK